VAVAVVMVVVVVVVAGGGRRRHHRRVQLSQCLTTLAVEMQVIGMEAISGCTLGQN